MSETQDIVAVLDTSTQSHHATNTESTTTHENQLSQDLALFLANPSLRAALADGSLDLKSYSETVHQELEQLESQCISVYRGKANEIAALRQDLTVCQTVLSQLHEMLLGFQADLGGLSGDIRHLQEKSRSLDTQLRNRRAAEIALRHYLQHIVVAPSVAETILTGTVNSTFLAAVKEVQQLYRDCSKTHATEWSGGVPVTETVSGQEMLKELDSLRWVAVKRSREYLLQQMALLRRPQTNVRLIQVHGLLKYAALYDFLEDCSPDKIAPEIFNVYTESMSNTVKQLFRTYSQQLLMLDATRHSCTRADVIAMDDAVLRESVATRKKRVDPFSLGQRGTDCLSGTPIAAHVAVLQKETFTYERLFSSLLGHLLDAVTNEHVFCRQFFKRDAFPQLFAGTLSLLTEQLENYLFSCYDALCLLLMIKVTHSIRRLARQRKIHSLDSFLDQVTHLLWPRLKTVMEGHLRSIQQADSAKLAVTDLHAHYVSRRFGEFCCSILLILHDNSSKGHTARKSSETIDSSAAAKNTTTEGSTNKMTRHSKSDETQSAGGKLLEDLSEIMNAFVLLLERLSEEHNTQKKRTVFLINNLDHIVCIFQERRVTGKECSKLVELLMKYREDFVEEELLTGFSKMIAFVQQTEAHMASVLAKSGGASAAYDVNPSVVESLVLDFATNWKSNIEQINRNVLSYFSNFRNGMEILKHCLTQLLLYYTRFQDIVRKVWKKPAPFSKDLVSTTVILAEIKKYALAI
jgi:vacuolar protein sorting-associated protein 52